MACYVYYDANGIIKEFVNSTYSRKGDDENDVYMYFDGIDVSAAAIAFFAKRADGTSSVSLESTVVSDVQIPFDPDRVLAYFAYNTNYTMVKVVLPSTVLSVAGLLSISPTVNGKVYGVYNVMVEDSVVQLDESMTMANFYYLLNYFNDHINILDKNNTWTGFNTFTTNTVFESSVQVQGHIALGATSARASIQSDVPLTLTDSTGTKALSDLAVLSGANTFTAANTFTGDATFDKQPHLNSGLRFYDNSGDYYATLSVSPITQNVDVALPSKSGTLALTTDMPSLDGYATENWVKAQGYITSAALAGYATQSWVQSQNYLTDATLNERLEPYALKTYVQTSLNGYATQSWVQGQGYVNQAWVTSQGYVTSGQLDTRLGQYATQAYVQSQLAGYVSASGDNTFTGTNKFSGELSYVDPSSSMSTVIGDGYFEYGEEGSTFTKFNLPQKSDGGTYTLVTTADLPNMSGYVTTGQLNTALQQYATQSYVQSALAGYATQAWVGQQNFVKSSNLAGIHDGEIIIGEGQGSVKASGTPLSSVALKSEIPDVSSYVTSAFSGTFTGNVKFDKATGFYAAIEMYDPSGDYKASLQVPALTANISFALPTAGGTFATQQWVTGRGYITSSALAQYATQAWVQQTLAGYATQTWVTSQNYLTASKDTNFTGNVDFSKIVDFYQGFRVQDNSGDYSATFGVSVLSQNVNLTIPNKSGTLAVTADIPTLYQHTTELRASSGATDLVFQYVLPSGTRMTTFSQVIAVLQQQVRHTLTSAGSAMIPCSGRVNGNPVSYIELSLSAGSVLAINAHCWTVIGGSLFEATIQISESSIQTINDSVSPL